MANTKILVSAYRQDDGNAWIKISIPRSPSTLIPNEPWNTLGGVSRVSTPATQLLSTFTPTAVQSYTNPSTAEQMSFVDVHITGLVCADNEGGYHEVISIRTTDVVDPTNNKDYNVRVSIPSCRFNHEEWCTMANAAYTGSGYACSSTIQSMIQGTATCHSTLGANGTTPIDDFLVYNSNPSTGPYPNFQMTWHNTSTLSNYGCNIGIGTLARC